MKTNKTFSLKHAFIAPYLYYNNFIKDFFLNFFLSNNRNLYKLKDIFLFMKTNDFS